MKSTHDDIPDTVQDCEIFLKKWFERVESDSPRAEIRILLDKRVGKNWINQTDLKLSAEIRQNIAQDLEARASGKPLSRIYGENQFWGLDFKLNEDTLDPRQDSETLIDVALKKFDKNAKLSILDLGTGSGCLLITLLHEFPSAQGLGSDISGKTLECAALNAKHNKVSDRCTLIQSDWWDNIEGEFDLIISNPPYIRSAVIPELDQNVQKFDPIQALDGGENGLQAYKIIFSKLFSHLKKGGMTLLEIGFDQAEDVSRLSKESGFMTTSLHRDLSGQPRVVDISRGDK